MTLARHMPYAQSSEHFATEHKERREEKKMFFYDGRSSAGNGLMTQHMSFKHLTLKPLLSQTLI